MKKEEIEKNIIPHLKSLEKKALKLKEEAADWKDSPRRYKDFKLHLRVIETILGYRIFSSEAFEKNKNKLIYRFQMEFSFAADKFAFARTVIEEDLKNGNYDSWSEIEELIKGWEAYLLVLENLSSLFFSK